MSITYQSIQTTAWATATSTTVTKPVGLAVGDLMIGIYSLAEAGGGHTLPSGFTAYGGAVQAAGSGVNNYLCYKTADSGDVAASNFGFGSGGDNVRQTASIIRITDATPVAARHSYNSGTQSNTQTPSIAAGVTPNEANTLIIQVWASGDTGATTTSTYAIATSNPSWTEVLDSYDGGSTVSISIAYANRPEDTATGNVSCAGTAGTDNWGMMIVSIPNPIIVTVAETATLTEAFTGSLSANINEVATLTEDTDITEPTNWNNVDKSAAPSWVNTPKS